MIAVLNPSTAKRAHGAASGPGVHCARPEPFVDPVRRREMIAEAAYFHAARRGFAPGRELDDWLAAECEVDAALTLDRVRAVYGDP